MSCDITLNELVLKWMGFPNWKTLIEKYKKEKECEEDDKLAREINEGLDELYGVKEDSEECLQERIERFFKDRFEIHPDGHTLDHDSVYLPAHSNWTRDLAEELSKCKEDIEEKEGCHTFLDENGEPVTICRLPNKEQKEQKAFRSELIDYLDFLIEQITYSKAKDSSKAISDLEALRKKYL